MKRSILPFLFIAALIGCTRTTPVSLTLSVHADSPERKALLVTASQHVIERRVETLEGAKPVVTARTSGETVRLTFRVNQAETAALLTQQLSSPLDFRIMREAKKGETPTITLEQRGSFVDGGITDAMLDWVQAEEEPGQKGRVTITFTKEGQKLLQKTFEENKGSMIGLFVRGGLVSSYQAQEKGLKDNIVIGGIPSFALAQAFADDVNTGAHVTFRSR
ncbi:MAG: hypothetical protein V1926_00475 [Candidatus Peregrinibacteria bacterium]